LNGLDHTSKTAITENEDDLTIQAEVPLPDGPCVSPEQPNVEISEDGHVSDQDDVTVAHEVLSSAAPIERSSKERKALPALQTSHADVQPDPPSPISVARTDTTTWERSHEPHESDKLLEDKVLDDDLPVTSNPAVPEFLQHDPEGWMLTHDYSQEDVAYNSDGHLVGATMQALVEKMTPHASIVDPAFSAVFFLTFRLFSTPTELVQAVIDRYNLLPAPNLTEEQIYQWQQRKGIPVRLRVSNFIKVWLEMYWRPSTDHCVLPLLCDFNRDALALMFPAPSQRIHDMITMRMQQEHETVITPRMDRIRDAGMPINPLSVGSPSEIPRPIMTKALFANLRSRNFASIFITDFDCVELARQLTIMECNLFCAIQPEEVLESGQEGAKPPVNVRAVSSLSTIITGWVAECILDEVDTKKRTALVKYFIKLADVCRPFVFYYRSKF